MTKFVLQAKCDEMAERVMVAIMWGDDSVVTVPEASVKGWK